MMTSYKMLCARTGATAIGAALALSPIHAAAPKPIVDLSKSPAVTGKAPPAKHATRANSAIGPFDQQTLELGGGAIAILALGAGAFAISRRKRREDAEWDEQATVDEPRDPLFDEPMFQDKPAPTEAAGTTELRATAEPSAFAWGNSPRPDQPAEGRRQGESWVERAYRGPTPDNPSHSLRTRLKRAAFFDKREREAAAGTAAPVDADAGLPEAMADERERETA